MSITSVAKVRARLDIASWEIEDSVVEQFIIDAEATIKNFLGVLPEQGEADYNLASSGCTDLAAFYTGISLPQPFTANEAKSRKEKIDRIKKTADENLSSLLNKPHTVLYPRSTTA